MVIKVLFLSSGGQCGVKFPGQFLKNGWTKTNALSTVCSTAWDTLHIKKWAQSVISSRSSSKNKVPYQMTPEQRYSTFRAKIDLLNYIKWGVKYIWRQFPLQMEFNEPIFEVKVMNFNISHVETWNVLVTSWTKWPYVSWPISQKRLKETKRYLQGFKYGSSWVQINKQTENRFTLRGDIPTSRYRTNWPKWPISVPVSVL